MPANPFETLDGNGVGRLMRMAVEEGRKARPNLKIGICGEHGGDPASVHLCHTLGLDYVSASPYRVPVARLAAAQAAPYTDRAGPLNVEVGDRNRGCAAVSYAVSTSTTFRNKWWPGSKSEVATRYADGCLNSNRFLSFHALNSGYSGPRKRTRGSSQSGAVEPSATTVAGTSRSRSTTSAR